MPAPRVGPLPIERMLELLLEGRESALRFDEAWECAWAQMIAERAFPHRTVPRRQWRRALLQLRHEWQASYEQRETPFSRSFVMLTTPADEETPQDEDVVLAELVA